MDVIDHILSIFECAMKINNFFHSLIFYKFLKNENVSRDKWDNFHSTFKYGRNMINNILTDWKNSQWDICGPKLLELLIFAPFRKVKMAQCMFHQNQMKIKKVLSIARSSVQNFKVSVYS